MGDATDVPTVVGLVVATILLLPHAQLVETDAEQHVAAILLRHPVRIVETAVGLLAAIILPTHALVVQHNVLLNVRDKLLKHVPTAQLDV